MFRRLTVLGLLTISFAAGADEFSANVEKEQFKAVADAVVAQYKVRSDESIRAIIKESANGFTVQYVNQKGQCTQEGADVFTKPNEDGTLVSKVTFFRYPRQKCK